MHPSAPPFIRRVQVCFHSQFDLRDNWAGVFWKTASVEKITKMDDTFPLTAYPSQTSKDVMVKSLGIHVGKVIFTVKYITLYMTLINVWIVCSVGIVMIQKQNPNLVSQKIISIKFFCLQVFSAMVSLDLILQTHHQHWMTIIFWCVNFFWTPRCSSECFASTLYRQGSPTFWGVPFPLRLPVWHTEVRRTAVASCVWEPHWCSSPSPHQGRMGFPWAGAEAAGATVQLYMVHNRVNKQVQLPQSMGKAVAEPQMEAHRVQLGGNHLALIDFLQLEKKHRSKYVIM